MITLSDAIQALNIKNFSVEGDIITEESFNKTYREFNVQGEVSMELGEPTITWSQVKAKYDELKAEYDANKYQRDRATSYPSIQEQLDMQYWDAVNGTKKWQEAVAKVKTDNPKSE